MEFNSHAAGAAVAGGGDADVAPTTGSNFMQDAISTHLNTPAGREAQRNALLRVRHLESF